MRTRLLLALISITFSANGQEWSPLGAEWYYDKTYAFSGDIDYHRVYCDSSINVLGIDCKRINIDYCACNNHFCEKLYTFERNDTIYFYNQDIDTFQILYNFNASQGDSWQILTQYEGYISDTVVVQVDSIGSIEINDKLLKQLFVTYNYLHFKSQNSTKQYQENSIIIESLGDLEFIINILDRIIVMCDVDFIHSLRCYEDTVLGFYSTGLRDSCTYEYNWTLTEDEQSNNNFRVYPNPTTGKISISNIVGDNVYYELYNLNGLLLRKGNEAEIDISNCKDGIYFLKIVVHNRSTMVIKIIKHLP